MQTFIDGLIFTLAFILIPAAALMADPPGDDDILYPGSAIVSPAAGNLYIQLDAGASQSGLEEDRRGFHDPDEDPNVVPDYLKWAHGTAPNAGLTLGYQFNNSFSLGVRFDYDSRTAGNTGTYRALCTMYDPESGEAVDQHMVTVRDKYSATVNYVSISALPAWHYDNFFVFAGPSVGIPISRTITESNTILDDGMCQFFYGSDDSTKQISGSLGGRTNLKTRLAVKLGVGYLYPLTGNIGLVFQASADAGGTNVLEKNEDLMLHNASVTGGHEAASSINAASRFHSLQGSIGLRINL